MFFFTLLSDQCVFFTPFLSGGPDSLEVAGHVVLPVYHQHTLDVSGINGLKFGTSQCVLQLHPQYRPSCCKAHTSIPHDSKILRRSHAKAAGEIQNKPISHQRYKDSLAWMLVEVPEPAHVVKVDLFTAGSGNCQRGHFAAQDTRLRYCPKKL